MNDDVQLYVASKIRELRESFNLSQSEFGKIIGWSQAKLSMIENGMQGMTIIELCEFADIFGRDAAEFLPKAKPTEEAKRLIKVLRKRCEAEAELNALIDNVRTFNTD